MPGSDCSDCPSENMQWLQFGLIVVLTIMLIYHTYQGYNNQKSAQNIAAGSFAVLRKSPFAVKAMRERATVGKRGGKGLPQLAADSEFVQGGLTSGADIRFLSAGKGTGSSENFMGGPEPPVLYDTIDRPAAYKTVNVGGQSFDVLAMDSQPVGTVVVNEMQDAAYSQEGLVSRDLHASRGFDAVFDNALNGY